MSPGQRRQQGWLEKAAAGLPQSKVLRTPMPTRFLNLDSEAPGGKSTAAPATSASGLKEIDRDETWPSKV
jgi:hypothetical protein